MTTRSSEPSRGSPWLPMTQSGSPALGICVHLQLQDPPVPIFLCFGHQTPPRPGDRSKDVTGTQQTSDVECGATRKITQLDRRLRCVWTFEHDLKTLDNRKGFPGNGIAGTQETAILSLSCRKKHRKHQKLILQRAMKICVP